MSFGSRLSCDQPQTGSHCQCSELRQRLIKKSLIQKVQHFHVVGERGREVQHRERAGVPLRTLKWPEEFEQWKSCGRIPSGSSKVS
jgi:hypothetical protein